MCTSGVRSALDDLFGRERQDAIEDGQPINIVYVDQHFLEGTSVVVDGVQVTVTQGRLEVDVNIDPVTVHSTLNFWGLSIPLPSIIVGGSGPSPDPGGPGGEHPEIVH
jgi:hypothetical protein